jgi:hypothetical protein
LDFNCSWAAGKGDQLGTGSVFNMWAARTEVSGHFVRQALSGSVQRNKYVTVTLPPKLGCLTLEQRLVGVLVMLQAYVFTWMIVTPP